MNREKSRTATAISWRRCNAYIGRGSRCREGFIVGFDNDSPDIFDRQIRFIQESGIVTAMVGILMVLRGTKLHRRLSGEGRIIRGSNGNNTDTFLNYVPLMNPNLLISGYQRVVRTIYSPDYFYARLMTFLKEFRLSGPSPFEMLHGRDIRAFLRSIYFLGILGKERWHYWKIFFWSLLRRPRLLPLAITMTIYGFHFRTVAERICSSPRRGLNTETLESNPGLEGTFFRRTREEYRHTTESG